MPGPVVPGPAAPGADAEPGLGAGIGAALERDRPELEVVLIDGGQAVYPLLIGVE